MHAVVAALQSPFYCEPKFVFEAKTLKGYLFLCWNREVGRVSLVFGRRRFLFDILTLVALARNIYSLRRGWKAGWERTFLKKGRRFWVDILTLVAVALGQIFGFFSKGDLRASGSVLFWWTWLVFFGFAPVFRALDFVFITCRISCRLRPQRLTESGIPFSITRRKYWFGGTFRTTAGTESLPSSSPRERCSSEGLPYHW